MNTYIAGWGVVSARGIGRKEFVDNVFRSTPPPVPLGQRHGAAAPPGAVGHCLEGFDVAAIIGARRGLRLLDRTSAIAVAAAFLALQDAAVDGQSISGDAIGVVLGTANGSCSSLFQFLEETYVADQPHQVSPEAFPRTVMNFAAGQVATLFGLKGLNTTISGGRLAGLLALRYAARAIRRGYCSAAITGSAQELSPQDAWVARHFCSVHGHAPPVFGEGSAMFALSASCDMPRPAVAEIMACETSTTGVSDPRRQAASLSGCIAKALRTAGVAAREICALSRHSVKGDELDEIETSALTAVLAGRQPAHTVRSGERLGEAYCASTALSLAALLALFEQQTLPGNACGLLTAISPTGSVGCLVLRRP